MRILSTDIGKDSGKKTLTPGDYLKYGYWRITNGLSVGVTSVACSVGDRGQRQVENRNRNSTYWLLFTTQVRI